MNANISELKRILDAWAVERGIMPAPDAPQPANAKQLAAHNTEVAREQKSALTLEKNVTAFKAALAEKIAPAALPADMPVQEMVALAKRLGLTVPSALTDVDSEPRPVDAAGVVVAPQSAAHDPAHIDGGAFAQRLGHGVHLLRWEPETETLLLSIRLSGDSDFEPNAKKDRLFATRAGKPTYARAGFDLPGAPTGLTRTLHIDITDSKPA